MRKYNRFTSSTKDNGVGKDADKQLTVIIPAAGMGHRMKSYGPKCLLPVNQTSTIIDKIISNVRKSYEFCDIIVVVGFESERIIKTLDRRVRIVENHSYEETNIVESIRLGINNSINDNALIIYGDLIFNINCIQGMTKNGSCVLVDKKNRFDDEEIGVTVVDGMATNFAYGLDSKWCHIAYLEGEEYESFRSLCQDKTKSKMYPFELFNIVMRSGGMLKSFEPKNMNIKEIDSLKDLKK